jgi:hypothetical protein
MIIPSKGTESCLVLALGLLMKGVDRGMRLGRGLRVQEMAMVIKEEWGMDMGLGVDLGGQHSSI